MTAHRRLLAAWFQQMRGLDVAGTLCFMLQGMRYGESAQIGWHDRTARADPVCRSEWRALGPVIEVMGFDFYDAAANMAPAAAALTARISEPGIWNAVAFWFELQLDEDTRLDTSPYCDKVGSGFPIWPALQACLHCHINVCSHSQWPAGKPTSARCTHPTQVLLVEVLTQR